MKYHTIALAILIFCLPVFAETQIEEGSDKFKAAVLEVLNEHPEIFQTEPAPAVLQAEKLGKEYYKDTADRQSNALYALLGLVTVFLGYLIFTDRKKYNSAVSDAKSAADRSEKLCDRTERLEEKAQEILKNLETKADQKLDEIQIKGEAQIKKLIKSAGNQRNISELWEKAIKSSKDKDYTTALQYIISLSDDYKLHDDPSVQHAWGTLLRNLAKVADSDEKYRQLLEEAITKYDKSTKFNPDHSEAYQNWGNSLIDLSHTAESYNEKRELCEEAISKYRKAIEINPKNSEAYTNWGSAIGTLASIELSDEKKWKLLDDSISKYEKAIEINPNESTAYTNWGATINAYAKSEASKKEKCRYIKNAISKYEKAIEINPQNSLAYINWGVSLSYLSEIQQPSDRLALLNEAKTKYEKAIELAPENRYIWDLYGTLIHNFYHIEKDTHKKQALIEQAERFHIKANPERHGGATYNTACCAALKGDKDECRRWLKLAEKHGTLPSRDHAMKDIDLKSVRNEGWFKKLKWKQSSKKTNS